MEGLGLGLGRCRCRKCYCSSDFDGGRLRLRGAEGRLRGGDFSNDGKQLRLYRRLRIFRPARLCRPRRRRRRRQRILIHRHRRCPLQPPRHLIHARRTRRLIVQCVFGPHRTRGGRQGHFAGFHRKSRTHNRNVRWHLRTAVGCTGFRRDHRLLVHRRNLLDEGPKARRLLDTNHHIVLRNSERKRTFTRRHAVLAPLVAALRSRLLLLVLKVSGGCECV